MKPFVFDLELDSTGAGRLFADDGVDRAASGDESIFGTCCVCACFAGVLKKLATGADFCDPPLPLSWLASGDSDSMWLAQLASMCALMRVSLTGLLQMGQLMMPAMVRETGCRAFSHVMSMIDAQQAS